MPTRVRNRREAAQAEAAAEGGGGAAEGGGGVAEGAEERQRGRGAAGGRRARGARGGHADGSGAGRDDPSRDHPPQARCSTFSRNRVSPRLPRRSPGSKPSFARSMPRPLLAARLSRAFATRSRCCPSSPRSAASPLACIRPSSRRSKTRSSAKASARAAAPPLEHRGKAACSSAASPGARRRRPRRASSNHGS